MPPDQDQFAAALAAVARLDAETEFAWAAWRAKLPQRISLASDADERERLEAALRLGFNAGFSAGKQADPLAQILCELRALRQLAERAMGAE